MCTNYRPSHRDRVEEYFRAPVAPDADWPEEAYQDYRAPIIRATGGRRYADAANYSMVPKQHIPPDVKRYSTMNARAETIGQLRSYASAWRTGQVCLVPMEVFYEPNWESGAHERWEIGMANGLPFAVAGLWRSWTETDGSTLLSFTQLTINADDHPLMNRFHRPGEEKRSLVIVPEEDYDDWLNCRDPEMARSFLRPYPAEAMRAAPAPRPRKKTAEPARPARPKKAAGDSPQSSLDF